PWTPEAVARVLTNPAYTGATVWGRTTGRRPVPPDEWIICPYAHQPIIDGRTFFHAQLIARPGTGFISPNLPAWEFLGPEGPSVGTQQISASDRPAVYRDKDDDASQ
ncbi:recombinase family protein, partial [Frankia tisae]|uniref:recombinase family protein n=1 Tax=Frankia tisae TaxID=2950104 RepID=UPI0021C097F9